MSLPAPSPRLEGTGDTLCPRTRPSATPSNPHASCPTHAWLQTPPPFTPRLPHTHVQLVRLHRCGKNHPTLDRPQNGLTENLLPLPAAHLRKCRHRSPAAPARSLGVSHPRPLPPSLPPPPSSLSDTGRQSRSLGRRTHYPRRDTGRKRGDACARAPSFGCSPAGGRHAPRKHARQHRAARPSSLVAFLSISSTSKLCTFSKVNPAAPAHAGEIEERLVDPTPRLPQHPAPVLASAGRGFRAYLAAPTFPEDLAMNPTTAPDCPGSSEGETLVFAAAFWKRLSRAGLVLGQPGPGHPASPCPGGYGPRASERTSLSPTVTLKSIFHVYFTPNKEFIDKIKWEACFCSPIPMPTVWGQHCP